MERLVDGAVGAVEDPSDMSIPIGLESSLDFDAAIPLIYPQGAVLFQEDDQYYETSGDFVGFWNSMFKPPRSFEKIRMYILLIAPHSLP